MNKEHFRDLVTSKQISGPQVTDELADLIEQFPYFQSARILYTKALFDQQHFKYNDQLKITAAYVADRKTMHKFITETRPVQESLSYEEVITENEKTDAPLIENIYSHEVAADLTVKSEETSFEKIADEHREEFAEDFEIPVIPVSGSNKKEDLPSQPEELIIENIIEEQAIPSEESKLSAMEIIELRLKELVKNKTEESLDVPEQQVVSEPIIHTTPPEINNETFDKIVINDGSVQEETLITDILSEEVKTESVSEVEPEPIVPIEKTDSILKDNSFIENKHSFTDWLHKFEFVKKETPQVEKKFIVSKEPTIYIEEPDLKKTTDNKEKVQAQDLIERFITAEPRIDATKAKFYSPVNMAKNSIVDHDELVSETLALIYFEQGNLPKAIQTLEKLSLKFPEKSRYFADQIQVLKNKSQT